MFRCHNAVYTDCFVCLDKLIKFFFLVCLLPDFHSGEKIKISKSFFSPWVRPLWPDDGAGDATSGAIDEGGKELSSQAAHRASTRYVNTYRPVAIASRCD